ncbi:hypothetical protein I314_02097 [Cryptococcus bacillisporus CA1873]|uniref:Uncharacterized protein n=1 Tax=Cryptococcus bacillisporus CA1873 TaxID=1296111 RepID=A0ABR5BET5_CRYGA|nr:hypothetical protein I314_02097 [Cryptococcus bacillisporus CA1873]|eukprot:KIR67680.1 hypothetical protein I314_02097 [Cryptococcus gattii CA1873]
MTVMEARHRVPWGARQSLSRDRTCGQGCWVRVKVKVVAVAVV